MPTKEKQPQISLHQFKEWGRKGGQRAAKKNSKRLKDFWKEQRLLKQAQKSEKLST